MGKRITQRYVYHRIIEWLGGGRNLKDCQVPTPLPQAELPATSSTRSGYLEPHPTWPQTPSGTEHPQPL